VQIRVPVQDAERMVVPGAPVGVAALHAMPFQVLTVLPMVATQKVLEAQDTVLILPPTATRGDQAAPE